MEAERLRTRVNPRVNRDLPEQKVEDKHPPADERTYELHEAVTSTGWKAIAVRNLKDRIAAIQRKLATDATLPDRERLRFIYRHQVFEQILEDPVAFFGGDGSAEA